jgi:hypothetical protein
MPDRLKFWIVAILSVLLFADVVANILRSRTVIGWTEFILLGLILLVGVGGLLNLPSPERGKEDEEN